MQRDPDGCPALRVGVTGHRALSNDPMLAGQVRAAARLVQKLAAATSPPSRVLVISPLAEGADQLVAEALLEQTQAALEVPLPMPMVAYLEDFLSEPGKAACLALVERAARVRLLPATATREDAYWQAGRYVVENVDVLIALWDGQAARGRGGTAQVVALAEERGTPLLWIHTWAPFALEVRRCPQLD